MLKYLKDLIKKGLLESPIKFTHKVRDTWSLAIRKIYYCHFNSLADTEGYELYDFFFYDLWETFFIGNFFFFFCHL